MEMENKQLQGWDIKELWIEYEKVAMHFNDLLLKLRIQALAVVAAVSAITGIFGKNESDLSFNWEIAASILVALILFWIAIWIIDACYYNRLLRGATSALFTLEKLSETQNYVKKIELSIKIKDAVEGELGSHRDLYKHPSTLFYFIVLVALAAGAIFCGVHTF